MTQGSIVTVSRSYWEGVDVDGVFSFHVVARLVEGSVDDEDIIRGQDHWNSWAGTHDEVRGPCSRHLRNLSHGPRNHVLPSMAR